MEFRFLNSTTIEAREGSAVARLRVLTGYCELVDGDYRDFGTRFYLEMRAAQWARANRGEKKERGTPFNA